MLARQKKSNWPLYVVALIVVALVALVVFHEIPLSVEHVEEVIK